MAPARSKNRPSTAPAPVFRPPTHPFSPQAGAASILTTLKKQRYIAERVRNRYLHENLQIDEAAISNLGCPGVFEIVANSDQGRLLLMVPLAMWPPEHVLSWLIGRGELGFRLVKGHVGSMQEGAWGEGEKVIEMIEIEDDEETERKGGGVGITQTIQAGENGVEMVDTEVVDDTVNVDPGRGNEMVEEPGNDKDEDGSRKRARGPDGVVTQQSRDWGSWEASTPSSKRVARDAATKATPTATATDSTSLSTGKRKNQRNPVSKSTANSSSKKRAPSLCMHMEKTIAPSIQAKDHICNYQIILATAIMRELPNIHINPSYVTAKGVKGQVRFEATSDEARLLLNQDIEKWDPQAVTSDTLRTFIVKGEIKIIRTGSDVTKSMPKSSISSNPAPARTSNPSIPTPTTVSPPNSSQLPPRSTQSEPQKHQPNPAIFMINNDLPLDEWERAMQALLKDRQKRLDERRKESEREGKILKNFAVVIERVSRR